MDINPEQFKFIEQYMIAYMAARAIEFDEAQRDEWLTDEQYRAHWAQEALIEAKLAWKAIEPLRLNNFCL